MDKPRTVPERRNEDSRSRGEAWKAALLSALVLPGAGQLYNRQWLKGFLVLALFLAASLGVLIPLTLVMVNYYLNLGAGNVEAAEQSLLSMNSQWIQMAFLVLASFGIYVYSIVDAYRHNRITKRSGDEPCPK
ncbi:MAG: DUF5683 domain-containing protein [bacterium]